jgi:CubicO group peptidase (beta-lactamase class C family)
MNLPRIVSRAILVLCLHAPVVSVLADVISDRMQDFVSEHIVSGAVTLVADADAVLHHEAVGKSDLESGRMMRKDDLFWIASMTKPMTAVCVLMLQEEGKLSIDDPVEKYLPEFGKQWLVERKDAERKVLVRPHRAVILRDLLTHTAGLSDFTPPRPDCTLSELGMAYSQQPLEFEPGSKWKYNNPGINVLGRIVEVVAGIEFSKFLQERLLDVLEMKDTTFWPSEAQLARMALSYKLNKETNRLEVTRPYFTEAPLTSRTRTPIPAGGLFSTAVDVANFYRMLLSNGEFKGKRLLKAETVRLMTTTQTGDIRTGFVEGMSWGLGFQVVKQPKGPTESLSVGSFGHGGAFATQSWADPVKGRVYVLLIQRAGMPGGDGSEMRAVLQKLGSALK